MEIIILTVTVRSETIFNFALSLLFKRLCFYMDASGCNNMFSFSFLMNLPASKIVHTCYGACSANDVFISSGLCKLLLFVIV